MKFQAVDNFQLFQFDGHIFEKRSGTTVDRNEHWHLQPFDFNSFELSTKLCHVIDENEEVEVLC